MFMVCINYVVTSSAYFMNLLCTDNKQGELFPAVSHGMNAGMY